MIVARRDPLLSARIVESFELRDTAGEFVRAGSALVADGDRLIAVQDDAFAFACIDPAARRFEWCGGDRTRLRKPLKPDFEAACIGPERMLHVFGSGARRTRYRIARMSLDAPYTCRFEDRPDLYAAAGEALGAVPNIEGAALQGERLLLMHRGSGGSPSAALELNADTLAGARAIVREVRHYELGEIGGIALSFTEMTPFGDALIYLAVAEDTPDAIADGPVTGGAVGTIRNGAARWTPLLESDGTPSRRKLEGIAFLPSGSVHALSDPDDHERPAELCRLELAGSWS